MSRPRRDRPADFEQRFVELGWEGCPAHYRTSHSIVGRWLDERGRDRLVRMRAAYVSQRRRRIANPDAPLVPVLTERLDPRMVSGAAHYLRHPSNGGWITFPLASGEWAVGSLRKTESELVAFARSKGWGAS